jgi:hypothetical protein
MICFVICTGYRIGVREYDESPGAGIHKSRTCSGALLPPSPPAEKATARQDQAVKALAECPLQRKGLFVPSLKRDIVPSFA